MLEANTTLNRSTHTSQMISTWRQKHMIHVPNIRNPSISRNFYCFENVRAGVNRYRQRSKSFLRPTLAVLKSVLLLCCLRSRARNYIDID